MKSHLQMQIGANKSLSCLFGLDKLHMDPPQRGERRFPWANKTARFVCESGALGQRHDGAHGEWFSVLSRVILHSLSGDWARYLYIICSNSLADCLENTVFCQWRMWISWNRGPSPHSPILVEAEPVAVPLSCDGCPVYEEARRRPPVAPDG